MYAKISVMRTDHTMVSALFCAISTEFEVVGECDGKEIVRNDFGRTVAVIPYIFNRTSILLARMVF